LLLHNNLRNELTGTSTADAESADAMEEAAETFGAICHSLIAEHLVACSAIAIINKSVLGRIL
jgi:hypothetical protein